MKTTDLGHFYWKQWVQKGSVVIDATCGNGQDLLFLARLLDGEGQAFGYDIQGQALKKTGSLLDRTLTKEQRSIVTLRCSSHDYFIEKEAHAIVYNLGYLPGGDRSVTTQTASTLKSLESACSILSLGGFISVTLYPGHREGEKEEKAVLDFVSKLPSQEWSILHHRWLNRNKAPSLLLMLRK